MTDNQDELVERVAISLFEASYRYNGLGELPCWQECSYQANEKWRTLARAALSALRPGDTYNGMMWVPVEPTEAQLRSARELWQTYPEFGPFHSEIYRAMLQALRGGE